MCPSDSARWPVTGFSGGSYAVRRVCLGDGLQDVQAAPSQRSDGASRPRSRTLLICGDCRIGLACLARPAKRVRGYRIDRGVSWETEGVWQKERLISYDRPQNTLPRRIVRVSRRHGWPRYFAGSAVCAAYGVLPGLPQERREVRGSWMGRYRAGQGARGLDARLHK